VAKRCGLKIIQDKLRQKRLQRFGHVRRETEGGVRKVGRSRKTWKDIVKRDLELIGVEESVTLDQGR